MQQIKRQFSGDCNRFPNDRKKKESNKEKPIQVPTCFEDLSNDLIYEIFEYLDYFDIYQSFFDVNLDFRHLIVNSNFPIQINISSISNLAFHHFYNDIIKTNFHRIQSISISNVCLYDYLFLTISNLSEINRLKTLVLYRIESKYLENLFDRFQFSTSLSSLSISVINSSSNKSKICLQLFRLSTLKFCKLSFDEYWNNDFTLPMATTNKQSSIEHFIMTNAMFIHQVDSLLSYLPQLSRLSLHLSQDNQQTQRKQSDLVLNHLTHLSIHNDNVKFDHFAQMMIDLFSNIRVFHVTQINYPSPDLTYSNATRWKQLITSHLKQLHNFNIQLHIKLENTDYNNQFTEPFWIERQWFITHEIRSFDCDNYLNIYSIKPYTRKSYTLYKSLNHNTQICNDKSNLNSVRHVLIENKDALLESIYRFPNATELTFQSNFSATSLSLMSNLNNILPLKQLTKLIIYCDHFSFKKVIELMHLASNLSTLELTSMPLDEDDHQTIKKYDLFQSVSATNAIKHLIYSNISELEDLKLLVALCPRMKCLTINTCGKNLQTDVQFLLDKNNEHTRHLCSLDFIFANPIWVETLNQLLQEKLLISNYTLKILYPRLYLTW